MNFIYFLIFIISAILALICFFKFLEPAFNKKLDARFSDFKYLLLCFIFVGISVFSCFKAFKIEEKMKLEEIKKQEISKENYIHKSDSINEQQEIIDYAESKGYDLKEINGGNILIFKKMIKEW